MDIEKLKKHADRVANLVKEIEELDPSAKILPNVRRSLQLDLYSCGVQSVYVILRYFGKRVSLAKLERELQTDWTGTEKADIKRVLKQCGLRCDVRRSAKLRDIREAVDRGRPVLITMHEGAHWAVAYGYSGAHVYLVDSWVPSNIWCRVSNSRFRDQWDNWMIVVK
jgi:ABC-type bacteriocin/lantibiotic exporter with double-glycine peptidase domain